MKVEMRSLSTFVDVECVSEQGSLTIMMAGTRCDTSQRSVAYTPSQSRFMATVCWVAPSCSMPTHKQQLQHNVLCEETLCTRLSREFSSILRSAFAMRVERSHTPKTSMSMSSLPRSSQMWHRHQHRHLHLHRLAQRLVVLQMKTLLPVVVGALRCRARALPAVAAKIRWVLLRQ